jgi:phosphohistidine phosphatase
MKLYLLRHGKANWPDWTAPDNERPLTAEGIEDMQLIAAALQRQKLAPSLILTSPLVRASRTAEIVGQTLGIPVEQSPVLQPGFDRRECAILLATHERSDLMLVGHEPDFSRLIRSLTGGHVKLSRGAIAAIDIGETLPTSRLLWLFPPKLLIRLGD